MPATPHILIIGGGIAGASLAHEAAARNRVTLIEAEKAAGRHATGRSAAMYLAGYGNRVVRALTAASRDFLHAPPSGFAEAPILRRRGLLTVAPADDAGRFARPEYAGQERLAPEAAAALVPSIRRHAIVDARFDPDAADIDVDLLHQGYLRGARARGAVLMLGARAEAACADGSGWRVETTRGPVAADIVVNAAGAWADDVARMFGAPPLGLQARRRTAILVDPPAGGDVARWPMVMTAAETLYFKPDAGMLLISPADETPAPPADAQPEELDVAIAIDRFETLCDAPVRRVAHRWAGLRTFAPDRAPVIGRDPRVPGFFWFAGQGGYGLQIAPALAALGAALLDEGGVRGGVGARDVAAFAPLLPGLSPGRFGLAGRS